MNFIFRRLFRKCIKPEEEGDFLIKMVCNSAHQIFLDKNFRRLVDFEKQSQTEQDRIFNEFAVTALVLLILVLDDFLRRQTERFHFWKEVQAKTPNLYLGWLSNLGIANNFVEIWRKLIDLRLKEYREDTQEVRSLWQEEFKKNGDSEILQDMAARVEALTVGTLFHITRGKAGPQDPLRRHLRTWVSVLDSKVGKRVGW